LNNIDIYNLIYKDIFATTANKACYVFLCGGAASDNIRDIIRAYLEKKQFQVLYPEDLFIEMLNRNKKSDLLEYETLLAENSDVICVICESIGSAVELGAFTQNDDLKPKMVVAINKKYARQKSFVMMGPVQQLKNKNKDNVVTFRSSDTNELGEKLTKRFKFFRRERSNQSTKFDLLRTYIGFIPLVIYFYQIIDRKDLYRTLKNYLKLKNELPLNYNELFNATIKYILKMGTVIMEFSLEKNDETFFLSDKGYKEICMSINSSWAFDRTRLHDKIRCAILNKQLNN